IGNNATQTKETSRCVYWMSNVPIRACRHKPAGRGVCRGMEASTSKRHARPGHQGYRDHLKSNRYRLKRKKAANRVQTNQSGDHDQEPKDGYHFQQHADHPLDSVCLRVYCPPPAASILAAPLMKFVTSRCSFSRDFFSMYIMWPAS